MRRALRPRAADDDLLDLASNDYLGLARDPRVTAAAAAAAARWGAGSTGSRLVTGSTELHARPRGASWPRSSGPRPALVFSSGYLANLGAVAALAGPGHTGGVRRAGTTPRWWTRAGCRGPRSSSSRTATSTRSTGAARRAPATARRGRHRRGVLRRRRPRAARRAARRARAHGALLRGRRGARARRRRPGRPRRGRARPGMAGEPDVVLTVTLSQVARRAGRRGAGRRGRRRAPGQHRPGVHLRHRAGAAASAAAALAALGVLRGRAASSPAAVRADAARDSRPRCAGAGLPVEQPGRRGRVGPRRRPRPRGRGRGRGCATTASWSAASGRRPCPTASPGCASPPGPT